MQWYDKFKVGQEVKVVKKVTVWRFPNAGECSWARDMDSTIGKTYKIIVIDKSVGYQLDTEGELGYNYWYPVESLVDIKGRQLLFDFMSQRR